MGDRRAVLTVGRNLLQDRSAVVGIGQTRFGKDFVESEEQLACMAIKSALDDAGIDASEVDGLCTYTYQSAEEEEIARNLGFGDLTFFSRTPAGGGAGCGTVGHGTLAIASGLANVVVAYRSRKRSSKASRLWMGTPPLVTRREMWQSPFGLLRPADQAAMLMRRYMHEFGATREHLASIACGIREHANRNPAAAMYSKSLSREQYFGARWISDPLCLFDCCLESDGAAAVVLVSAERARDCRQAPAYVHSFAQGLSRESSMMFGYFGADPFRTQSWACASRLWEFSDFKPANIDVAQLYDAFSPEILFSLEGFGFCARGEAAGFIANGAVGLGGRLPINTSGGSLSEAYLHGFNLILEAVRQIRGTSTAQVPNVQSSFVSSSDGVPTGALLLRK
jgi:acetyl-CoA acetyltransferase